jgi:hypothetical protein
MRVAAVVAALAETAVLLLPLESLAVAAEEGLVVMVEMSLFLSIHSAVVVAVVEDLGLAPPWECSPIWEMEDQIRMLG